ncbi:MAG TPA: hypothetical protein VK188_18290 [Holophaga sp.]|nr:hypothetical protein [Holophaga sp.]
MNCRDAQAFLPDQLKGLPLPPEARAHVAGCPDCAREFQGLGALWEALDGLPRAAPAPALRRRVVGRPRPWLPLAAAFLGLLGTSLLLVRWSFRRPLEGAALAAWVDRARDAGLQRMAASPSPGERRNAIALLGQGDKDLAGTLLALADGDPETSVRLAAVEALYLQAGNPLLRARLAESVARQDRLEVQLAMADLLVALRERQATEALRRLLREGRIRGEARPHIQALLDARAL